MSSSLSSTIIVVHLQPLQHFLPTSFLINGFPVRSQLLPSIRSAFVFQSFNTNAAQVTDYDAGDHSSNVERRNESSVSLCQDRFPDVFNPSPSRSLSQVLNLMDQFMEEPFSRGVVAGARRGWDVKEDDDGLYLRMDML